MLVGIPDASLRDEAAALAKEVVMRLMAELLAASLAIGSGSMLGGCEKQSQYPESQYPQNQYSQNQYPQNQYPQNQYPQNQYPQNQSQSQYPQNTYSQGPYQP